MTHPLAATIRSIPDFPKKGILFRDITTLLNNPAAFRLAVDLLTDRFAGAGVTKVVSIESRGFILGAPIAYHLGAGFVPVRKPGKLPAPTLQETYTLEYGTDTLEIHQDAVGPEDRVLIVDDLLATGGTVGAACRLVERLGGKIVGCAFLIELSFLKGRSRLGTYEVEALVDYAGEE